METTNLWQILEKGGLIMIPIVILFAAAIYIFIERWLVINNAKRRNRKFLQQLKSAIETNSLPKIAEICSNTNSDLGKMFGKGLENAALPPKEIDYEMEGEGKLVLFELERGMSILAAIAGIAPMIGFLGTIIGVIKIFSDIAASSEVSIAAVSGGLYVKMISSAAGLIIGVMAFVFYQWLNLKISRITNTIERNAINFIDYLKKR